MTPRPSAHSAVLLAGGRSLRFGSDKLLAALAGAPLVVHSVRNALAMFREVVLVAKDPEKYRDALEAAGFASLLRSSTLLLRSDLSPRETPLAGLQTGLAAAGTEACFVCAADMPFAANLRLLGALNTALRGHAAAAPRFAGVIQPLAALYRRAPCLDAAGDLLARTAAGPRLLLERVDAGFIEYEKLAPDDPLGVPFLDADTPAALAELARHLA